jgi:hypothetical protein
MLRLSAILGLAAIAGCTLNSRGELDSEQGSPDASADASAGAAGEGGNAQAGSAGAGGKAGAAAGGTDTGGGGGKPGIEDCLNEADDDGDGKTDCEDEDCTAGYECVDAVPEGWEGYLRVLAAPYDAATPALDCPWGAASARYFGDPDNTALCEPCTCGAPTGFSCAQPHIRCSPDKTDCSDEHAPGWDAQPGCHTISTSFSSEHVLTCHLTATTEILAKGTCKPSAPTFSNFAMWKSMADVCMHPWGGGCGAGACVLKASAPFNGPLCIRHLESSSCPDGWPVALTLYSSGIEERACGDCSCDANVVTCGGGVYTFYDANNCVSCVAGTGCGAEVFVGSGTGCVNLTDTADGNDFSAQITSPAQPTSCEPSGGAASGQIKALGETTVCCRAE